MRPVQLTFGSEEKGTLGINNAGFLPLAGKDIGMFVGLRMNVRRNCNPGMNFSKNNYAARDFVLVQNHQFDARVRTRLPNLLASEGDVLKHYLSSGLWTLWQALQLAAFL